VSTCGGRGLLAEFGSAAELLDAARHAHAAGQRGLEAYSPMPVEGLREALGRPASRLPWLVLAGAVLGGGGFYFLEWYSAVIDYPINIGGRPYDSWPAFIFSAVEMTILFAALFGVAGMLFASGLPRLYHPLFAVPAFDAATRDGFFLYFDASDAGIDRAALRRFADSLRPRSVHEVDA
jgi:Alternative complex III, ActD subunit